MSKNEKIVKAKTENETGGKEPKARKLKFNLVDLVLVLIVISVISALIAYFLPEVSGRFSKNGEVEITYVLEFRNVDEKFIANIQNGNSVYDAGQNFNIGTVKSVSTEPYKTLEYDKETGAAVMKEQSGHNLTVTVTASAIYAEGEGYSINGMRIAVGTSYDVRFPNFVGKAYCVQLRISTK